MTEGAGERECVCLLMLSRDARPVYACRDGDVGVCLYVKRASFFAGLLLLFPFARMIVCSSVERMSYRIKEAKTGCTLVEP